jgi:hypothetical protein
MFTTTDQSLLARERAPPRAPGSGRCGSTTVGHRPPPWSRQPPPTSGPPASVTSGRSPPGGPVRPSPITPGRPAATPPTSASTARHKAVIVLSDVANDVSDLGTQLLAHRNSNPQPRPGTPVMTHNLPGPTREADLIVGCRPHLPRMRRSRLRTFDRMMWWTLSRGRPTPRQQRMAGLRHVTATGTPKILPDRSEGPRGGPARHAAHRPVQPATVPRLERRWAAIWALPPAANRDG